MSDYLKLKYDIALSDFQREQIAKLFLFCHSFKVEITSFGSRWLRYKLPLPTGMKTVADIYKAFLSARLLCVQDDVLKLDVDAWESRDGSICIIMNDALTVIDRKIAEYRNNPDPTPEDMNKLLHNIYEALVMINGWMFSFQMNAVDNEDLTIDRAKMFYPHSGFLEEFQDAIRIVDVIEYVVRGHLEEDANVSALALHGFVMTYIQLSQFSMLCALMMDAFCGSIRFSKALVNIQQFIQLTYHNYYLYRVELPMSSLNDKPVAQRGAADHTTLMKIYLFDRNKKPVLLRIDLPHAGSENLHVNLSTTKGEKLPLDHYEIECDQQPEEITPVFDSLRESMELQTPNLYKMVDTTIRDEQVIFSEMEKFVDYFELCAKHFTKENYTKELNKVGGFLGFKLKPYSIYDVLTDALHFFGEHPTERMSC